jgi:uncharacterized protein (DUF433 family)
MSAHPRPPTRQRSFRLEKETLELLDARAEELGEPSNALAQRLLEEALRTERHPLIRFQEAGDGVRRPGLAGHRLFVWDVLESLLASDMDVGEVAWFLRLTEAEVRACVGYYAEFSAEVDALAAEARAAARRAEGRRERRETVLG